MHLLAQRVPSNGAIDLVPGRFEQWYAAECGALARVAIVGKIVKRTEGVLEPGTGDAREGALCSFTMTAVGTKTWVPSVFELLAAGGHKLGTRKMLERGGLEACTGEGPRKKAKVLVSEMSRPPDVSQVMASRRQQQ